MGRGCGRVDLLMASDRYQPAPIAWTPWFVLVVALTLTVLATIFISSTTRQNEELRFNRWVRQSTFDVSERLDTYIALLRGGAAYVSVTDELTRQDWRRYVGRLRLRDLYPGVQGIGFSALLDPAEVPAIEAAMREQGALEFRIWPDHPRDAYHAIVFLEPEDRRNLRAIGYDMFSDPVRRRAMERARDTGLPAATGRVTLVQEIDADQQAGMLIYVPVYRDGDIPMTIDDRREAIRGFVYSPFRVTDLITQVFGESTMAFLGVEIYDTEVAEDNLLFRSVEPDHEPRLRQTAEVTIAGQPWTLVFTSRPAFERYVRGGPVVPGILVTGVLLSLLLFGVTLAQAASQARLRRVNDDLRRSEQARRESDDRLRLALGAANLIAYSHDLKSDAIRHIGDMRSVIGRVVVTGAEYLHVVHPDDRLSFERSVARAVAGEGAHELEYRIRDDQGNEHWVRDRAVVEFDERGVALRMMGVAYDVTPLKRTEHRLRQLNETLEQRVADRTVEAEQRSAQLRALANELTQAEQRERRRLAQVLHDHLQQLLVASLMRVTAARRTADEKFMASLDQIEDLVRQAITSSRSLTIELSPPVLYDAGLGRALEWLSRSMQEKHNLTIGVSHERDLPEVSEDLRAFLFQAVRELLFNVVKHAKVSRARVALSQADGMLEIEVADDGPGFDPAVLQVKGAQAEHFGLFSIQQRLELLGGRMSIEASPGQGTRVTLRAPLDTPGPEPQHVSDILGDLPESDQHAYAEKLLSAYERHGEPLRRVMLVDADGSARREMATLLQAQPDIEVVAEAASVSQAAELADRFATDVIVLSVAEDMESAADATRRIRTAAPDAAVIVSGGDGDTASAVRTAGADAAVNPPAPAELVLTLIRQQPRRESTND
jgi:CHASE1-domain containing sensor protein/signal transduction histidine kinase/CheY-like chemotaxis protein